MPKIPKTVREAKCGNCKGDQFDKKNHKCQICMKPLVYKCSKCAQWFSNSKSISHAPCYVDTRRTHHHKIMDCTINPRLYQSTIVDDDVLTFLDFKELESSGNPVKDWLSSIGMDLYTDEFIKNGFDRMEIVKLISIQHLSKMNVKFGHALFIWDNLEKFMAIPK